jgi:hypothetical protein
MVIEALARRIRTNSLPKNKAEFAGRNTILPIILKKRKYCEGIGLWTWGFVPIEIL